MDALLRAMVESSKRRRHSIGEVSRIEPSKWEGPMHPEEGASRFAQATIISSYSGRTLLSTARYQFDSAGRIVRLDSTSFEMREPPR